MRRRIWLFVAASIGAFAWGLSAPAFAHSPVSSHSQVYTCCTPYALKERVFAEAKAMGATFIRVDVELGAIYGPVLRGGSPDWSGLDEITDLSRAYSLPVLGVILDTPLHLSTCPEKFPYAGRCAPRDPAEYGRLAGEVAAHAGDVIRRWEIVNEPDAAWAFEGTPQQYAAMLAASYDEIHRRVPQAKVANGGVMSPRGAPWLSEVFATEGLDAATKFDIANVHVRGHVHDLERILRNWRRFFRTHGFSGPIWVTEHGYPAEHAFQADPAYQGGEAEQASYLRASLLELTEAGADQVFVTLRDALDGPYASEGIVHIEPFAPFPARRKLAFMAVRSFVESWPFILRWRASAAWQRAEAARHRRRVKTHTRSARADRRRRQALELRAAQYLRLARIAQDTCDRPRRAGAFGRAEQRCEQARAYRAAARSVAAKARALRPHIARQVRAASRNASAARVHDASARYYDELMQGAPG